LAAGPRRPAHSGVWAERHRCSEGARTGEPGQTPGLVRFAAQRGGQTPCSGRKAAESLLSGRQGPSTPARKAGAGAQHRRWQRDAQAPVWEVAAEPACTPGTWRLSGLFGQNSVGVSASRTASQGCTQVRPNGRGGRQRQEGNGCSDAARLPARGMLRRVRTALRGTVVTTRRDFVARHVWSGDSRVHEAEVARAGPGNAANPFRTGMQHARSPERSKPSRWWKSTRAEQDVQRVELAHRRKVATPAGSGRTGTKRMKGATRAKPRRGGPGDWSRSRAGALKMAPSPWRTRSVFVNREHQASRAREDPKGHCSDAEGRRGSGEGPASCYCVRPDADPQFERAVCRSRPSKGRPTSRVLASRPWPGRTASAP
jgi:hypothetical protein